MKPRLLTPEIEAKVIALLGRGHYRQTVAKAVGIHPNTLGAWLRNGEREWSEAERVAVEEDTGVALEPMAAFARAAGMAEGQAEIDKVADLSSEGEIGKAAQFFLSRRYPTRWGRAAERVDVQVGGSVDVSIDPRQALLRRLAATAIGGGTQAPDPGDEPGRGSGDPG